MWSHRHHFPCSLLFLYCICNFRRPDVIM
uniref:Uncharacterized protein n=1 Tax=Anguilla anguilla TaxID=7936 RepID=A0A0E9UDY6_ANGAN